jgi:hypothetical protein
MLTWIVCSFPAGYAASFPQLVLSLHPAGNPYGILKASGFALNRKNGEKICAGIFWPCEFTSAKSF